VIGRDYELKKKIRSRIGLTLVELIVVIAILGMVAGMGVGMVGSAIKNYHTAQVTSKEQDTALAIEHFILNSVRTSSSVKSIKTTDPKFPAHDATAYYLYFMNGVLRTMRNEVEKAGQPPQVTIINYDGVAELTFKVKKAKTVKKKTDEVDGTNSIFLYYEIKMKEGYELKGSAIINNASAAYKTTQLDTSFIEIDPEVNVKITNNPSEQYAFAIMK